MLIVRDEGLVRRRKKIGQFASLLGLAILVSGMVVTWVAPRWGFSGTLVLYLPFLALLVGFILSNIGIYYTNRWGRSPRPDQVLDASLKGLGKEFKLYHYALRVPHVLLTPVGAMALVIKTEGGVYTVDGDRWRQRFSFGRLLRFMGQEGMGNPTREAQYQVDALRRFVNKRAPDLAEVPISAAVVFINDRVSLNVGETSVPVLRATKLKGHVRSWTEKPLSRKVLDQLQALFDEGSAPAGR
jgi:hypothetical protein